MRSGGARGRRSSSRPSAGRQALGAGANAANVAGLAGAGGEFIKQLYEGDRAGAAITAGVTGLALKLGERAGPLALMYMTIQGYDEEVKRDANRAGSHVHKFIGEDSTLGEIAGATTAATVATGAAAYKGIKAPWEAQYTEAVKKRSTGYGAGVENFIGEGSTAGRLAGAAVASAAATGEVAFRGTFGVAGKGIGEGLAAGYLWLTGDDEYEVPAYYEQWAANTGKLNRARAHLNQLTAAQPDSPVAAAAGQLLRQVAELEAINSKYRQRKTWTYWLSAQASVVEQKALSLRN